MCNTAFSQPSKEALDEMFASFSLPEVMMWVLEVELGRAVAICQCRGKAV